MHNFRTLAAAGSIAAQRTLWRYATCTYGRMEEMQDGGTCEQGWRKMLTRRHFGYLVCPGLSKGVDEGQLINSNMSKRVRLFVVDPVVENGP